NLHPDQIPAMRDGNDRRQGHHSLHPQGECGLNAAQASYGNASSRPATRPHSTGTDPACACERRSRHHPGDTIAARTPPTHPHPHRTARTGAAVHYGLANGAVCTSVLGNGSVVCSADGPPAVGWWHRVESWRSSNSDTVTMCCDGSSGSSLASQSATRRD